MKFAIVLERVMAEQEKICEVTSPVQDREVTQECNEKKLNDKMKFAIVLCRMLVEQENICEVTSPSRSRHASFNMGASNIQKFTQHNYFNLLLRKGM